MTSLGIEPTTFWLVAQYLNKICYCLPHTILNQPTQKTSPPTALLLVSVLNYPVMSQHIGLETPFEFDHYVTYYENRANDGKLPLPGHARRDAGQNERLVKRDNEQGTKLSGVRVCSRASRSPYRGCSGNF
jgi:hypothetical protein